MAGKSLFAYIDSHGFRRMSYLPPCGACVHVAAVGQSRCADSYKVYRSGDPSSWSAFIDVTAEDPIDTDTGCEVIEQKRGARWGAPSDS